MKTIRLKMIALACAAMFVASFSCFAQTSNETAAASDVITASTYEAADSLQHAFAQAMMSAVLSQPPVAGTQPTSLENVAFSPEQADGNSPEQSKQPPTLPQAPSLGDLGFTPDQTQGNAQDQARLDKRTHMLKIHQRLGLITTAPLLATLITSVNAGGKNTSSASRDLHTALGGVTADLYFTAAYFAIRAPRIPGTQTRGPIRVHKALAWIHGPGMILTPILGIMAFDQKNRGEKVHGIAAAHGPVAIVTAGAFGAAILSVSLKF